MNAPPFVTRLILSSIILCLSGFASPAPAADADGSPEKTRDALAPQFDIHRIKQPGPIFLAASGDFDGDSKSDVLLFHKPSRESYKKFCTVYFQRNGKFDKAQSVEVQLSETISAVTIKDIDSDGVDDLCAFDDDGVSNAAACDHPPNRWGALGCRC
jgi:hypothetical protein